jgi:ankyrin repeat protein
MARMIDMASRQRVVLLLVLLSVVVLPLGLMQAADSPVASAAESGNLAEVRALIRSRADVNLPAQDGSTALLWAAYHSDLPMAQALITAGANVNAANRYGVTPLLQAARTGDVPMMEALLRGGADAKLRHTEGETPLMAAARTGKMDAVRVLLQQNLDVNAADGFARQTPLMWAAADGHVDVVKALMEAGALPNLKAHITTLQERSHADHPTGGFTALHFAARNGHTEVVRELLANPQTNPSLTNGDGATPLMVAIMNDRFDLAKQMIEWGADANDGALYFAVDMHDITTDARARDGSLLRANHQNTLTALDLIAFMLDKGADPNKAINITVHSTTMGTGDAHNGTPFLRAATASDVAALKLMIGKGADINQTPPAAAAGGRGGGGNAGRTAMMITMGGGRGYAFGGGPGFGREGPPPFREASNRTPLDAVKVLLEAGANPDIAAPDGTTAVHQAAAAGSLDMLRSLAQYGAKLDTLNKDGLTALDIAEGRTGANQPAGRAGGAAAAPPGGGRGGAASRQEVAKLLRELMGLPPVQLPAAPAGTTPAAEPDANANNN